MAEFDTNFQSFTSSVALPKAVDTILSGNVMALRTIGNGKPWRRRKVERVIIVTKQSNGRSFSGLDEFNTNKSDTKRKLAFDPRGYEIPVVIEGMERDVAATDPDAAVDLVLDAIEEAQNSGMDDIGTMFYADGTGNSNKDFLGLAAIVDDGGEVATYGGLARATYTSLRANEYDITGNVTLAALATAVSASQKGNDKVTLHVTTKTQWDVLESLIQATISHNVTADGYKQLTRTKVVPTQAALRGEVGFDCIMFRGAPVVADDKCPANKWFGLNERWLEWYGIKSSKKGYTQVNVGANKQIEGVYGDEPSQSTGFNWSGLLEPVNQYAEIGHLLLLGNLISFNPNRHFTLNFS